MKKKIIIIGGGGHGRSCIDVVESTGNYTIEGIVDTSEKIGLDVLGYPVIGSDSDLDDMIKQKLCFLIGIGQIGGPGRRKAIYKSLRKKNAELPTIVSPFARVSVHARIGQGTIIMHNAVLNAGCEVGENCIINTKALVEHDAIVGNHCHVSTTAVINGDCKLGDDIFIGSNTALNNGISVPDGLVIGAGQFVRRMANSD